MKKTLKFWTKEEDKMIAVVFKKTQSQSETARILTKELGRSVQSIQIRTSKLFGTRDTYRRKPNKSSSVTKGVTLPAGFTFDIKPNRVVMFTDHVRLYF